MIAEAALVEEAMRAHGFAAAIAVLSFVVIWIVLPLGGDPLAKHLCIAALTMMSAASVFVWRVTHDPGRFTIALYRFHGIVLITCVVAVEYYIGFFSAVPVALGLGIYSVGHSADRRGSILITLIAIATYTLLASLTATGVLQDRSLFPATSASLGSRAFVIMAVTAVLLVMLHMARVTRQTMLDALKQSHEALQIAHEREAQLQEAHQNLDRALKAGVGKPGRYTGIMAGEYRLGLLVGIGAMGEVYAAKKRDGDQAPAAVKLLQADALEKDDLVGRFLLEGTICRQLVHPNIVRVFEVGCLDVDGAPFLAMERLHGEDLATRLRRDARLSLRASVTLVKEMTAGLQYAHDAGVIHRDLKPHNLYHATDDAGDSRWKILDFGVSKMMGSSGTLTQKAVVGTPGYMSPEQARGFQVDHRSDLFSTAVVMYRALTGRQPFGGSHMPQVLFEVCYKAPERPSALREDLPSDLDHVMAVALAKDPGDRFGSVSEFAEAFVAASRRRLDDDLRDRGAALVKAHPWGASIDTEA